MHIAALLVLAIYVCAPIAVTLIYALAWPGVFAHRGWFLGAGSIVALVLSWGPLYWAALPLTRIGISGARPGQQPDGLGAILGLRFGVAGLAALVLVAAALWLLAHMLGASPASKPN